MSSDEPQLCDFFGIVVANTWQIRNKAIKASFKGLFPYLVLDAGNLEPVTVDIDKLKSNIVVTA